MFFGRENELKIINDLLTKPKGSMLIYGKRKIGKTTLLTHALKNTKDKTIYYECIKSSLKDNVDNFISVLVQNEVLPVKMLFPNFIELFGYLNSLLQTLNIVIDEYPYLKTVDSSPLVDSIFQNIIDNHLSNIRLFISGSHIGMMKDLLKEKNALFGRFSSIINLKELDYKTTSLFYKDKSSYDKIAFYSVFGGSPYVNEQINPALSLKENIINTILNPLNTVYNYADSLLISDLASKYNAERIFMAISNGKKRYSDIESKLDLESNGSLSKQLNVLLDMGLVSKLYPINKSDDNKKARYELTDNLLRFFFSFVYTNKSALQMLGANAFYEKYIMPSLTTFISHRFEDICRTYFSLQVKAGNITHIRNIGTYYYDDSKTKTNGEFDVVLQVGDSYDIYEVKYLSSSMTTKQMQEEVNQINNIKGLKVNNIGFVSINDFEPNSLDYHQICGDDLYK